MHNEKVKYLFPIAIFVAIIAILPMSCSKGLRVATKNSPVYSDIPNFSVDVYIENSGSMNGYMVDGSELRDAVYSYLTALNSYVDTMKLNYINSQIINLDISLGDLISKLTPAAFSKAGGNTANSNFKQILSDVINKANDSNVVVFVSDCILDIPNGSADGFLNITKTDVNNIVTTKLKSMPTLSFSIYHLESMFDGYYFPPKGGKIKCKDKRPYYLWVIGSQKNLAYIQKNVPDKKIEHGVSNYCAFAPSYEIPIKLFSAGKLLDRVDLKTSKDGMRHCKIEMDLSLTLLKMDYLLNPMNYSNNSGNISIENITELPNTSVYSHLLDLAINDASFSEYIVVKSPGLPEWVENINGNNAINIEKGKTFSLKYIIGGVAEAYDKYKESGKAVITTNKY